MKVLLGMLALLMLLSTATYNDSLSGSQTAAPWMSRSARLRWSWTRPSSQTSTQDACRGARTCAGTSQP